MPPIRTDRSSLGLMVAGAAAFIFLCTVPALATLPGARLHMDRLLLSCLTGGIVFGLLFCLGHLAARRAKLGWRPLYSLIGSVSLVLAYASQMRPVDLRAIADQGLIVYFFVLPALVGAAAGFIYAFKAGWEVGDDDPKALADAVDGAPSGPSVSEMKVRDTEYFDGPLRTRTSFLLMILSAALATALVTGARALFVFAFEASHLADQSNVSVLEHTARLSLFSGLEMAMLILVGIIPISLSILAGHYIARAFKTHAHWAYFLIGLGAPLLIALLSFGFLLVFGLMICLPTAIGMALYRSFAGLEPVPVREDILVSDPRALVPEGHARRRFGRVIRS